MRSRCTAGRRPSFHPPVVSRNDRSRCDIGPGQAFRRDLTNNFTGGAMSASAPYPSDTYPTEPGRPDVSPAGSPVATADSAERVALWLALSASLVGVVVGVMMIVWPE